MGGNRNKKNGQKKGHTLISHKTKTNHRMPAEGVDPLKTHRTGKIQPPSLTSSLFRRSALFGKLSLAFKLVQY